MARGLSDLQQFILRRASRVERVSYADVLESFFGWQPLRPIEQGAPIFSPAEIGERRYNSGLASLSRACARLRERGLVEIERANEGRRAVVVLTDKGREMIGRMSQNVAGFERTEEEPQPQPIEKQGAQRESSVALSGQSSALWTYEY